MEKKRPPQLESRGRVTHLKGLKVDEETNGGWNNKPGGKTAGNGVFPSHQQKKGRVRGA